VQDGSREPANLENIARVFTEPLELIEVKGVTNEKVEDDVTAREGRISEFVGMIDQATVNLNDAVSVKPLLTDGDVLLSTVRCCEVQGTVVVNAK